MSILNEIYFRNQVTKFVMLFVGRVGSSYLLGMLNSHPNISAKMDDMSELKDQGAEAQMIWAKKSLTPPLISRIGAIGFKTKPANVLDPNEFNELLKSNNCKIIQLQRRNRIKAVVSHLNGKRLAEATGMWGLYDEKNRPSAFLVDPKEFSEVLLHREKVDEDLMYYVRSLNLPVLPLYYEDLQVNQSMVLQRIYSFLGVPQKSVQGNSFKITSDDLREVILNFDELRAQYVNTQYEQMFDEVLYPVSA